MHHEKDNIEIKVFLLKLTCIFHETERERQIITYKNKTMSLPLLPRPPPSLCTLHLQTNLFSGLAVFLCFFLQVKCKREYGIDKRNTRIRNSSNNKIRICCGVLSLLANRIVVIWSLIASEFFVVFSTRRKSCNRGTAAVNDLMRTKACKYIPFNA